MLRDAEAGIYADPAKVHRIDHVGENFSVAGPHLSEPSPQRTPALILATASPAGALRAGRHAELVFTHGPLLERTVPAVRAAAQEAGRDPADPKFVVQAAVITGRTQEEVDAKLAQYQEHRSLEGMLVHQSVPIRALEHPRERTIAEALEIEGLPADTPVGRHGSSATVGELLDAVDEAWQDRFFVAGTPEVVADAIEHWLDVDGIDGINLRQYHSFDTVRDFAELVSPILRERGRLPEAEGTLRHRLSGADRLPEEHPAARFRGAFADRGV